MPEAGKVIFGVELECMVPTSVIHDNEIGGHGEGFHYVDGWVAERDGSLSGRMTEREVEFVSPLFSLVDFDKTFDSLEKKIGPRIRVNNSCGCHIHFSWVPKDNTKYNGLYMQLPIRTIEWIRYNIHEKIKKQYPNRYADFEKHYFRDYAKQRYTLEGLCEDYSEFVFTSDQGVEWRSFNLNKADDWETIRGMIKLGCETIEEALNTQIYEEHQVILDTPDDKGALKAREWEIFQKVGIEIMQVDRIKTRNK